jgi:antitoxin component YwqK of YwqJK toxin-antitoxin module
MLKALFVLLCGVMICGGASAQYSKKDTLVGYMLNSGEVVANKDSADYYMLIMPLDSNSGQKFFPVLQFYKNGKTKMVGQSLIQDTHLRLQGRALSYYPNGRKQSIINYEEGNEVGDAVQYYPNGQLWKLTTHKREVVKYKVEFTTFLKECRDSTGKVLTENGNGTWIDFDDAII